MSNRCFNKGTIENSESFPPSPKFKKYQMTEECNCLPLKQILSCPFKTCENTQLFQNFWGFSLGDLLASTRVSGSPWVQECWTVDHCLPVRGNRWSLSLQGIVFPATSFFPPRSFPSRIGGCRVLPSAPGWVVTQAEGNLPGVPAVPVCVDAYQALRLCGVPNALEVLAPLAAELSARGWSTPGKVCLAW